MELKWRFKQEYFGESCNKFWLKQKRKALFPIYKVLTALHQKLAFHNTAIKDSDTRKEHARVSVPHHEAADETVVETDRFSTASSSTMFNSCSDVDEDGASLSSPNDKSLISSEDVCQASGVCSNMGVQSQQGTNNGKHRQRYIEDYTPVSVTQETLNEDVSVWEIEQRIHSCGVLVPHKITEDSLLSTALWGSLIQTAKRDNNYTKEELREFLGHHDVSKALKSKRTLHKTRQLLFDCVREITINLSGQQGCKKQFVGPEKLGKIIWERTREWSQQAAGNETNNVTNLDYLSSISEWSKFEPQVKDISVEIADAVLERVNNEIVAEMMEKFCHTNRINNT